MKNRFSISKRLLAIIAAVALLFVCIGPVAMGLAMSTRMTRVAQFRNGDVAQAPNDRPFNRGSNADVPQNQAPYSDDVPQVGPNGGFNGRDQWRGGHTMTHDTMRGRGGFSPLRGIFGFLGGLVRLLGLGLLIAAGIVLFRRGTGNTTTAADVDDANAAVGPEMTEEEIRAAMKRLGITKIEL